MSDADELFWPRDGRPRTAAGRRRWLRAAVLATAIVLLAALVSGGVLVVQTFGAQDEIGEVATSYFDALSQGRVDDAYALLCADAKEGAAPTDLESDAFYDSPWSSRFLAGTAPSSIWPWEHKGVAVIELENARTTRTRRLEMRKEGQWMVCPSPAASWSGETML